MWLFAARFVREYLMLVLQQIQEHLPLLLQPVFGGFPKPKHVNVGSFRVCIKPRYDNTAARNSADLFPDCIQSGGSYPVTCPWSILLKSRS